MLRSSVLFLLTMLIPFASPGQRLSVSITSSTAGNDFKTYSLDGDNKVKLSSGEAHFSNTGSASHSYSAIGFSQDRTIAALVDQTKDGGQITLFASTGDTLSHYSTISLRSHDPSLAVYPASSGHVLLRENIMNFSFHSASGSVGTNLSAASESEQGETVTQVAVSPGWETTILYTPKIKRSETLGSKVELLTTDQKLRRIFDSNSRFLKNVSLSEDGNIMGVLTAAEGSKDQVLIQDKYGNKINKIMADEDLMGIRLSETGQYVTLFSTNRVWVYNAKNGDRLGSTSLSDPVYLANYFPEDELLLILSGRYSADSGMLNKPKVKAVSFSRSDIVSRDVREALRFHEAFRTEFDRSAANAYLLRGANQELDISAAF